MTTPPPCLALCDAATKGPRYINDRGFTPVRVSSGTPFKPTGLYATFDAGDYAQTREQGFANAELCCRFSPEVARKVYEALIDSRTHIRCEFGDDDWRLSKIKHALDLLDGLTTTSGD